nr:nucleosome assembly protein 1-like 5 [Pipistrellus kuhlii]
MAKCGAEGPGTPAQNAPKPTHASLENLPNAVKCRVLALKKLQKRCDKIKARFDKESQALEQKYKEMYKPVLAEIQELCGELEGYAWTVEGEAAREEEEEEEVAASEEEEEEQEEEKQPPMEAKNEAPNSRVPHDAQEQAEAPMEEENDS